MERVGKPEHTPLFESVLVYRPPFFRGWGSENPVTRPSTRPSRVVRTSAIERGSGVQALKLRVSDVGALNTSAQVLGGLQKSEGLDAQKNPQTPSNKSRGLPNMAQEAPRPQVEANLGSKRWAFGLDRNAPNSPKQVPPV